MTSAPRTKTPPPVVWEGFHSPTSANIAGARYRVYNRELRITFTSGVVYRYTGVPRDLWERFRDEALSKGKFFANAIKPFYEGVACDG